MTQSENNGSPDSSKSTETTQTIEMVMNKENNVQLEAPTVTNGSADKIRSTNKILPPIVLDKNNSSDVTIKPIKPKNSQTQSTDKKGFTIKQEHKLVQPTGQNNQDDSTAANNTKNKSTEENKSPMIAEQVLGPQNERLPLKMTNSDNIRPFDLDLISKLGISGKLSVSHIKNIKNMEKTAPTYTRSYAILLTHAQQSNDPELINESLDALFSLPENQLIPSFLLAKAHQQFNLKQYDNTTLLIIKAEKNWDLVGTTIRKSLIIQKEMLKAYVMHIEYLESGDPEQKDMTIDQFSKVTRLARSISMEGAYQIAKKQLEILNNQ